MNLNQDTNLVHNFQHVLNKIIRHTNKIDIANEFNHIFTETGHNLAESKPYTISNNFTKFL